MSSEEDAQREARERFERQRLERKRKEKILFTNIKDRISELRKLLEEVCGHWTLDDGIYRFYHQSFKVYYLQKPTLRIIEALKDLVPGAELNPWFLEIVKEGTGKEFAIEHNRRWLKETRPIVEAFFHARYFLEMAVKSAGEFGDVDEPPQMLPSGWAAVLYLYNIR